MEQSGEASPDLVLSGVLTGKDDETYRPVYFKAPPGTKRLTVAFRYDRASRTTIDLGLFDGERFRGWSGGDKDRFTGVGRDISVVADDARHWVRVNVRDAHDRLILIGNPTYLNPAA